jgi:hypothetical protein
MDLPAEVSQSSIVVILLKMLYLVELLQVFRKYYYILNIEDTPNGYIQTIIIFMHKLVCGFVWVRNLVSGTKEGT